MNARPKQISNEIPRQIKIRAEVLENDCIRED